MLNEQYSIDEVGTFRSVKRGSIGAGTSKIILEFITKGGYEYILGQGPVRSRLYVVIVVQVGWGGSQDGWGDEGELPLPNI